MAPIGGRRTRDLGVRIDVDARWWDPDREPLLEPPCALRIESVVHEIGAALRSRRPRATERGVASGPAGIAMLYGHLSDAFPGSGYDEDALREIELAIDELEGVGLGSGLFSGFPGIGWTIAHLQRLTPGLFGSDDPLEGIDDHVASVLDVPRWTGDYDLIEGLVGLGVYGLERGQAGRGRAIAGGAALHLAQLASWTDEGATWFTAPDLLPEWQRRIAPDGYHNLGLAHGIPGVLAFLAAMDVQGWLGDPGRELLAGGVRWILCHGLPPGSASAFGSWWGSRLEETRSRVAWCYGDLGVASALLQAARRLGRGDWEARAIAIAGDAASRPMPDWGVLDAGLCHGATGNAHIFHRFARSTGDERFRTAAMASFESALAFRRPGEGIAGFLRPGGRDESEWTSSADPGFLTGAAGIALALLAAVRPSESGWDRLLLLDLPDRAGDG